MPRVWAALLLCGASLAAAATDCSSYDDGSNEKELCSIFQNCNMTAFSSFWMVGDNACLWHGSGSEISVGVTCHTEGDPYQLMLRNAPCDCSLDTSASWPTTLQDITLTELQLSGDLDMSWYSELGELRTLDLANNSLTGTLDLNEVKQTALVEDGGYVSVSMNGITGVKLYGDGELDVSRNTLADSLPNFVNFSGSFNGENNEFKDVVDLTEMWEAQVVDLTGNSKLFGTIGMPTSMSEVADLKFSTDSGLVKGPISFRYVANDSLIDLTIPLTVYCDQQTYCGSPYCVGEERSRDTCTSKEDCEATCQCGTCYAEDVTVDFLVNFYAYDTQLYGFDHATVELQEFLTDFLDDHGLDSDDFEVFKQSVSYDVSGVNYPWVRYSIGCDSSKTQHKIYKKFKHHNMKKKVRHHLEDEGLKVEVSGVCIYDNDKDKHKCSSWTYTFHIHDIQWWEWLVIIGGGLLLCCCLLGCGFCCWKRRGGKKGQSGGFYKFEDHT